MASISSALWKAIASSVARARCARVVPRVMPDDRAARVRIPVGRAEPRERRHEVRRRPRRARSRRAPRSPGACAMIPSPSRSHWIAAPGDEDAALERVGGAPAARCHATVVSRRLREAAGCVARVHEQEAAGAVGVLRHARAVAGLAEERGLLVAGDAGDRRGRRAGPRKRCARRSRSKSTTLGQHRARNAAGARAARRPSRALWMLKSSVREALLTSVTCARARRRAARRARNRWCRRRARRARRARARRQRCRAATRAWCPEKYASRTRPVLAGEERFVARLSQSVTSRRGASVLPDDGVGHRAARGSGPRAPSSRAGW